MNTDSEFRLEMKTYSVRCAICFKHKSLYKHPNFYDTDDEDKVLFCRSCMPKVEEGVVYPYSNSREVQGFRHFNKRSKNND